MSNAGVSTVLWEAPISRVHTFAHVSCEVHAAVKPFLLVAQLRAKKQITGHSCHNLQQFVPHIDLFPAQTCSKSGSNTTLSLDSQATVYPVCRRGKLVQPAITRIVLQHLKFRQGTVIRNNLAEV